MPLDTISGAGRISSREAGVTLAGRIVACGILARELFVGAGEAPVVRISAPDSSSKTKRRPSAAEVETTAVDIKFLENFRERRAGVQNGVPKSTEAISLFIRL
jgi:hypothetical protein